MRLLIVEDDVSLRHQIGEILKENGYEVFYVEDFNNVLNIALQGDYDLIILDINLPYLDGNYYCRMIRKNSNVPIVITSARGSDTDQILSMELGSDDYLIKPFNIQILLSKINAILRRTKKESRKEYKGLSISDDLKMSYHNKELELTKNEYKILSIFISKPKEVISREELLESIWDDKTFVDDNTLTVNMTRLKNKIESLGLKDTIKTKRGMGYLFEVNE